MRYSQIKIINKSNGKTIYMVGNGIDWLRNSKANTLQGLKTGKYNLYQTVNEA